MRLTDANLDAISYMVQHGRLTIPEVAAFLETGSWSPSAQEIITARPDEDVIVFQDGKAINIRPAYAQSLERVRAEAEAANATSERMNEEMLDFFLGTNPDDEPRARRLMQAFRIDLHGQKDRISTQRGLDVDDLDTNQLALFINQWAFEGTNFRNAYESEGWMHFVGLGPNFANEDTAPFSLEREQAMRDLGLNIRTLPRATIQTADNGNSQRYS